MKKILWKILNTYELYVNQSMVFSIILLIGVSWGYEKDWFIYGVVPILGGIFVLGVLYVWFMAARRIWQKATGRRVTETITRGY